MSDEVAKTVVEVLSASPVSAVANAVASVSNLLRPLVETAVAEKYERKHLNDINQIQHAMVYDSPDELWSIAQRLSNECGHPPTPTGGHGKCVPVGLLHALLLCAAEAIRDRNYMVKVIDQMGRK